MAVPLHHPCMRTGQSWRLGYQPALDGIRGTAILLVVLAHTQIEEVRAAGGVGVTMFFTLSGFLITALLLEERSQTGRISLTAFYARRARRLFPALALFLAVVGALVLVSDSPLVPSRGDLLGALFYVGNYTTGMQAHDTVITHTWSLAVEEQFYIFWPLLLIGVLGVLKAPLAVLLSAAMTLSGLAVIARVMLWNDGTGVLRVYFGTDTRMDGLLVGCMAAMWLHGRSIGRNRPALAATSLVLAGVLGFTEGVMEFLVMPTVVPWLTAATIVWLVQEPRSGFLTHRALVLIGQRSYGIYLWHYPIFGIASAVTWPWNVVAFLIAVMLTAALTQLSWRCVEVPFLTLRSRRSSPRLPLTRPFTVQASESV